MWGSYGFRVQSLVGRNRPWTERVIMGRDEGTTRQIEVIQGKGTKMKRLSRVLPMTVAALGVCLVAAAPVHADVSNGDFSAGDDF